MKVAIIGAGNMGGAIARGMAQGTVIPAENITVSNPSSGKLDQLKAAFPALQTTHDNRQAAQDADIVILAVKPWLILPVLQELNLRASTIVVSVAAGVSCEDIAQQLGEPQQSIFRVIPNTAISVLQSMTLITSYQATEEACQLIEQIFQEMGETLFLPEKNLGAATSLASCGIAYAFKFIQASMQAGIEMGIYPKDGIKLVAQTLKGAGELMLENDTHPSVEIDKVCTPGGYTIKGINALEQAGFAAALIEALKASRC